MIVPILAANDIDKSIAFYVEKLGFKEDMRLAGPDGTTAFAGVSLGKATFMIGKPAPENAGNGVVFMVYLPEEADIDKAYADVKSKGVEIVEDLKTEYWGDRVFTVHDPDGYVITVAKTVHESDMEHVAKVMSGEVERE